MRLRELIEWLERQDAERTVMNGFGEPHSDRGDYSLLAFEPVKVTTFGEMLAHAAAAEGRTFTGWKGGEYVMNGDTRCRIGKWGECGEDITRAHLELWLTGAALTDVLKERARQDAKWGGQNHDPQTWVSILAEEVGEMAKEANDLRRAPAGERGGISARLYTEAVQTAAVALAIVECLARGTCQGKK